MLNFPSPKENLSLIALENMGLLAQIRTGYYLELVTPETMKLLGSTGNKITIYKNGKNVPHLQIIDIVLSHCNIVINDYQHDSRVLYTFVLKEQFKNSRSNW